MAVLQSQLRLSLIDQVSGPIKQISGALGSFQRQTMVNPFRGMIGQLAAFSAGYLGVTQGIGGTVGAAMDFESAFADVRKVVEATDLQFADMQKTIRSMATTLPMTAVELAQLYAAAGESGVATEDLNAFALMAGRVGIAFDMSAGQAGESLAKLKTQLGLSVAETGDMADAINHLSNSMASKASDITDFMLRVGALSEMGGFAKEEIAALGSAMIAAGAAPDTAGTAMQNVVKALTRGNFAKKDQRDAAKALGLDLPTIAKQMQRDAPKALRTVLTAIAKAPKEQQLAILSQFFGDEAKAFAPLLGNIGLLDQALGSVSDRTKYAGSAFNEFVERSKTTENVLKVLRNKFSEVGMSIGDRMLPTVKEAAKGIGDVLDTFSERAHIFDDIRWAWQGMVQGMGGSGDVREQINAIGDFLFGEAKGPTAKQDHIAAVFAQFREYGADLRALNDAVRSSPLASFLTELGAVVAGMGLSKWFRLFAAAAGIKAVIDAARGADSVRQFVDNLKGLTALEWAGVGAGLLMVANRVKAVVGWFEKAKTAAPPTPGGAPTTAGTTPGATPAPFSWKGLAGGIFKGGITAALGWAGEEGIRAGFKHAYGPDYVEPPDLATGIDNAWAAWRELLSRPLQKAGPRGETFSPFANLQQQREGGITAETLRQAIAPPAVQDVRITNKEPPVINQSNVFNISGVSDPVAAGNAAAARLGQETQNAVRGSLKGGPF